ncbi:MAG TPA: adenine phosphoribosyltransferase [bacterium]|nr:adenine phosphoribosyltransferase [bacterium]
MDHIKGLIRTIPDFPKSGIAFRDLTTLFGHGSGFQEVIQHLAERYRGQNLDVVAGVESRGFILAAPLAFSLGLGFVPIRKPGKLPGAKVGVEYELEYGTDRLEIHTDAIQPGARVLLVDDLLATGGTMEAACRLVEQVGGQVAECAFVVELVDLRGRQRLERYPIYKLVEFMGE